MDSRTKKLIQSFVLPYLEQNIEGFKITGKNGKNLFKCPLCKDHPKEELTANIFPPNSNKVYCFDPQHKDLGDIFDMVKIFEPGMKELNEDEIGDYLVGLFKIKTNDEIQKALVLYESLNWSLVPLRKGGKEADVEKKWQLKEHRNKREWEQWLDSGLNIGCFDKETEILTDQGWKFFKDLNKTEKVATLNWKNHEIEYQKPVAYITYPYEGKMYQIKSNTIDMCITPNHNVYYRHHSGLQKYDLKRIDMINENRFEIPITGKWKGSHKSYFYFPKLKNSPNSHKFKYDTIYNKLDMKLFLEFLGWFLSEGHIFEEGYQVTITQHSTIYKKQIRELLEKMPYNFIKLKNSFTIRNKQLYTYLKENCYKIDENSKIRRKNVYCCYNKSIPDFIKNLTSNLISIILTSLIKGDGYKSKRTERYYTTSEKLSEDVQELYFKIGYTSFLNERKPRSHFYNGKLIKANVNSLEIIKQVRKFRSIDRKKNIQIIDFNDNVYCVEVPNGIIYVRRNNHCYWSGNCNHALSNLLTIDIDAMDSKIKKKWYAGELSEQEKENAIKNRDEKLEKVLNTLDHPEKNTLHQKSLGGIHLFFLADKEITKTYVNIEGVHVDIETGGAQIVLEPSIVCGESRKIYGEKVLELPKNIKERIIKEVKLRDAGVATKTESTIEEGLGKITGLEGKCNNVFVKVLGQFRKFMAVSSVERAAYLMNEQMLDSPMEKKSVRGMVREIEKYHKVDMEELSNKVLERLEKIEEASIRDLTYSLRQEQKDIEDCMRYLCDKDLIYRKGNRYKLIPKIEWRTDFLSVGQPINYKIPWFSKYANFDDGNMILLGGKPGSGKTHVVANMILQFKEQGIKPHLISVERGSKIGLVCATLGINEGDYFFYNTSQPWLVPFKKNAITIIDWLKPPNSDYAKTDLVYEKINDQLTMKGGNAIVFAQLRRSDGNFFATDQIDQYAALCASLRHPEQSDGQGDIVIDNENPYWETRKIRDSKNGQQIVKIPLIYDRKTKRLIEK